MVFLKTTRGTCGTPSVWWIFAGVSWQSWYPAFFPGFVENLKLCWSWNGQPDHDIGSIHYRKSVAPRRWSIDLWFQHEFMESLISTLWLLVTCLMFFLSTFCPVSPTKKGPRKSSLRVKHLKTHGILASLLGPKMIHFFCIHGTSPWDFRRKPNSLGTSAALAHSAQGRAMAMENPWKSCGL